MVDIETLLQPVLDDSPDPRAFGDVRARAVTIRRWRATRIVIASVLVIGLAGGAVAAVAARNNPSAVSVVGPAQTVPTVQVGQPTTFAGPATAMISAFGSIWVSQPNRVARIDPATGRVTATIPVAGTSDVRNLAPGAGAIWVDDTGTESVTRIDPAHNQVTATISMRGSRFVPDGLAFVDGKLWIVRPVPDDVTPGDIVAIDPATNRIVQHATIPRTFTVTAGTHWLWYVDGTDLRRINTGALRTVIVRRNVNAVLTAVDQHLWLLTPSGVIEIDERTGRQVGAPIRVRDDVNLTAAIGPGVVWLAAQPDSSSDGTVAPYDLTSHRLLAAPVRVGFPIGAMVVVGNALWVDADGLTRIPFVRDERAVQPTATSSTSIPVSTSTLIPVTSLPEPDCSLGTVAQQTLCTRIRAGARNSAPTLEFQLACRQTLAAARAAESAPPAEIASVVNGIMNPEIDRLLADVDTKDVSGMFRQLAQELIAGKAPQIIQSLGNSLCVYAPPAYWQWLESLPAG